MGKPWEVINTTLDNQPPEVLPPAPWKQAGNILPTVTTLDDLRQNESLLTAEDKITALTPEPTRFGKQTGAGFMETFGSSPLAREQLGAVGNVVPNSVWGIASLPNVLFGDGESTSAQYYKSGVDIANTTVDTTDAGSTTDLFGRILGGSVLPIASGLNAVTKTQKVAKGIAAVIAPGMQSKTKLGKFAEIGVPTAGFDQLIEANDAANWNSQLNQWEITPTPRRDYYSTLSTPWTEINPDNYKIPSDDQIEDFSWADAAVLWGTGIAAGAAVMSGASLNVWRKAKNRKLQATIDSDILGKGELSPEEVKKASPKNKAAAILRDAENQPVNWKADPNGYFDMQTIADGQLRDSGALYRKLLKDMRREGKISPQKYEESLDMLVTTFETQAMTAKITEFLKSGQFPRSERYTKPVAQIAESISRLKPKQMQQLNEALVAGTRLDDLKHKLIPGQKTWGKFTESDLQARIDITDADPILKGLRKDVLQSYRDTLDYMYSEGMVTAENYKKWTTTGKNYVPLRLENMGAYDTDTLKYRNPNIREGLQPGNLMNPTELIGENAIRSVKFVEHNKARKDFIQLIQETQVATKRGKARFLIEDVMNEGDNTVKYIENGTSHFTKVNDVYLYNILKESPEWGNKYYGQVERAFVGTSNIVKAFLTGKGNPAFPPVSAGYDTTLSFIQAPRGQNIGKFSELLNKYIGADAGTFLRNDPSAFANPFTGAMQGIWSDSLNAGVRRMQANLDTGKFTTMRKFLGEQDYEKLKSTMLNAYRNSGKRLYQRQGAGTSVLWGDSIEAMPDIMREIAPGVNNIVPKLSLTNSKMFRYYSGILDSLHSGNRLGAFSKNLKRSYRVGRATTTAIDGSVQEFTIINRLLDSLPKSKVAATQTEMRHSARLFREIGGDLSKKGGIPGTQAGKWIRLGEDSVPYVNAAVQASTKYAKELVNNPGTTIGATVALTFTGLSQIYTNIKDNPVAWEHYKNWGASNRGRYLPFYDDEGNLTYAFAIPHEIRPLWSGMLEATLILNDDIEGTMGDAGRAAWQRVWEDIIPGGGIPLPDIVSAVVTGEPLNYLVQDGINSALGLRGTPAAFRGAPNPNAYRNKAIDGDNDNAIYRRINGVLQEMFPLYAETLINSSLQIVQGIGDKKSLASIAKDTAINLSSPLRQTGKPTSIIFDNSQKVAERISRSTGWVTETYNSIGQAERWVRSWQKRIKHPETTRAGGQFYPEEVLTTFYGRFTDPQQVDIIASGMNAMAQQLNAKGFGRIKSRLRAVTTQRDLKTLNAQEFPTVDAQRVMQNQENLQQLKLLEEAKIIVDRAEQDIARRLGDPSFRLKDLPSSPETGELVNRTGNPSPWMPIQ